MRNNILTITTIITSLILLASCGNTKTAVVEGPVFTPKAILIESFAEFKNSAFTEILASSITGNKLSLVIAYNGGCSKHSFQLLASKLITNSFPPQRHAILYHDNGGDDCRERIEETLIFDISPLAYSTNEIIIKIKDFNEEISYTPK